MIENMKEFYTHVDNLISCLSEMGEMDMSNKIKNSLHASSSGLEILGELKLNISELKKNKIYGNKEIKNEIKIIKKFIKKYWP